MQIISEPQTLQSWCVAKRRLGGSIALVPTMGALHRGHMALVAEAKRRGDTVVVSVFVNPTQFASGEELGSYPRTLEADCDKCRAAGVAAVFTPTESAMYPAGAQTRIGVGASAAGLCGKTRADHFEGVVTIVAKLFNLVGPCDAVFGRKDYQQWRVISRLVADLFMPVNVIGVATVREDDGLALSSRNAYLTSQQRKRALCLARGLTAAARAFDAGERRVSELRACCQKIVDSEADVVDYVKLADHRSVLELSDHSEVAGKAVLAIAAQIGANRLIDNMVLGEESAPIQGASG